MLREYELFYIIRPDLDEEQVRAAMDEVASMVAGDQGEVTKSSLWGRRRLAYPIAGFSDGYYALKEVSLPGERLRDLERQLRLDEQVIRHLVSLRQVYYLPEDEDRRGRPRARNRRGDGAAPPEPEPVADGASESSEEEASAEEPEEEAAAVDAGAPVAAGAADEVEEEE